MSNDNRAAARDRNGISADSTEVSVSVQRDPEPHRLLSGRAAFGKTVRVPTVLDAVPPGPTGTTTSPAGANFTRNGWEWCGLCTCRVLGGRCSNTQCSKNRK